jgi:hypothetical protein
VDEVTASDKGGRPGQWSARKAQLAVALYQKRGGGYIGPKSADNALAKWTQEQWRTRSGRPSLVTGERYLPSKALAALSPQEYGATTRAKRAGMSRGQQFVPQPERIAMKTSAFRNPETYPCSRCGGSGTMPYAVAGGVCFKCAGTGRQRSKPRASKPRPPRVLTEAERAEGAQRTFTTYWRAYEPRVRENLASNFAGEHAEDLSGYLAREGVDGKTWQAEKSPKARVYVPRAGHIEVDAEGKILTPPKKVSPAVESALRAYMQNLPERQAEQEERLDNALGEVQEGLLAWASGASAEEPPVLLTRVLGGRF